MAETKYVIFNLGEQKYGIRLACINGIEQTYNIIPVPKTAECIQGIIHLRDMVIPVYDLKCRFCIDSEAEYSNRQLLIAETEGMKVGFEADNVIGIVSVSEENIKLVPFVATNENTGYLENIIKVNFLETNTSEILISIDIDKLLSETDIANLKAVTDETGEDNGDNSQEE